MRILFIFLLFVVAGQAPAGESQMTGKTLVVGSEQDYPPFALGKTDETAGGFTVELWQAVAAKSRINYTLRVRPFHQLLEEFKNGRIDVLINLAQNEERRRFADFTVPTVIVQGAIFVRDGETAIRSEADLAGKSIIVLNADPAHDYAISKGWQKQLILARTAAEGLKLLAAGKHDAMLLIKVVGLQTLEKLKLSNVKALTVDSSFSGKFSFAVRNGESDLLAAINDGLVLTKSSGIYDELYHNWFGVYEEKQILNRILLKYLAPAALILAVFLGFFYCRYRDERERELAFEQVLDSQQRLQLALESGNQGLWDWNYNSNVVYYSPRWKSMLGYAEEELPGILETWLNLLHPEDKDVVLRKVNDYIYRKTDSFEAEFRMRHKNGRWVDILSHGKLAVNNQGERLMPLRLIGTNTDISDRKNKEAQRNKQEKAFRNTLIREVHHRIKNNIQGVSGILRQYSLKYPETLAPINQAISQLHSIAMIYGLQGQDTLSRVHVCELMETITKGIENIWKITVKLDRPFIWPRYIISESEAVPLALVLNELVLNAVKHGKKTGYVNVTLRTSNSDGSIQIVIRNHGDLPPGFNFDEKQKLNTGLNLVASLLPSGGAKLTIEQQGPIVAAVLELYPPIISRES